MSRLWSRFGIRTLSIALLIVAVIGGIAIGRDRQAQQRDDAAAVAGTGSTDDQLRERAASRALETSRQRAAAQEAAEKAEAAAKSAALRAHRVDDAVTRKKAETGNATVPYTGPIPTSCSEYSGNRAIGCALLLERGFKLAEMPCLDKLWSKESGWNHRARNSSSGAYGIPQAVPGSKMASVAADWQSNPATQIKWGLGYIKGRYSTPCGAWQQSQSEGWY